MSSPPRLQPNGYHRNEHSYTASIDARSTGNKLTEVGGGRVGRGRHGAMYFAAGVIAAF